MTRWPHRLLHISGVVKAVNFFSRNRLLTITYHGLYDAQTPATELPDTFIHVDDFAMQLAAIKTRYHVLAPNELSFAMRKKCSLPAHSVLITFDDGYESFYRLALPVLNTLHIKAIIFAASQYIVERTPYWFDRAWLLAKAYRVDHQECIQNPFVKNNVFDKRAEDPAKLLQILKRMSPSRRDQKLQEIEATLNAGARKADLCRELFMGMTPDQLSVVSSQEHSVGGHTHSHTVLSAMSEEEAKNEILMNKNILEQITGKPCEFFAYPNGGREDYLPMHQRMLRDLEFTAAFSLTQGRSNPLKNPMDISRVNIVPEDCIDSIVLRCSGLQPTIDQFRHVIHERDSDLSRAHKVGQVLL